MRQFRVATCSAPTCNAVDPDKQTLRASCSCPEPDLDLRARGARAHAQHVAGTPLESGQQREGTLQLQLRPRSFPFFASAAKRLLQFSSRAPWQRVPSSFSFSLSHRKGQGGGGRGSRVGYEEISLLARSWSCGLLPLYAKHRILRRFSHFAQSAKKSSNLLANMA